jgi:hypothetical protein
MVNGNSFARLYVSKQILTGGGAAIMPISMENFR